ncbi:CLUMA_CG001186, isoform A [Clunio marinus]|uniref:CLUMA_CG001186, isoform A n=1 Tax=Clunio marinus TaxID=568069 RepID=A0A1J1HH85_9DIPT|nr:CLUMA_CG001186, isoform A [Clunio marinus]
MKKENSKQMANELIAEKSFIDINSRTSMMPSWIENQESRRKKTSRLCLFEKDNNEIAWNMHIARKISSDAFCMNLIQYSNEK